MQTNSVAPKLNTITCETDLKNHIIQTEKISSEYILKTIDKVVTRTFKMDFAWDWSAGVAFYGIIRAYQTTGNQSYIISLKNWIDEYLLFGIPPLTINAVALGYAVMAVYEHSGEEKYLEIIKDNVSYLKNEAIRFGDGIFQHTVSQNYNFPEQAWADTLFMAGLFLVQYGKKFGDEEAVKDGLNQFKWHVKLLQDKDTNLFYHAWDNIAKNNLSKIYWARANGWCAITISEVLKLTDAFDPMFVELIDALRDQMSSIVRLQQENGLWCTVLDEPDSYTETSASCALVTALINYKDKTNVDSYEKYITKAMHGILAQIDHYGKVNNVSGGTAVMRTKEDYMKIPKERIQGWGQGLALAFLAEVYEKADK